MPSKPDIGFLLRVLVLIAVPCGLVAAAIALSSTGWSTVLYCAALISLAVMLIETLSEVRRLKHEQLEGRDLEVAEAADHRRLAELMKFVGETAPTVAELSRTDGQILDGWFDLISNRVRRTTGSGLAGAMLLRETLIWTGNDFVGHYEVTNTGGSEACILPPGERILARDTVKAVLLDEVVAESIYVSEFSLDEEPFWLCVLLSTSAPHLYLDTLSRAMVPSALLALASRPLGSRQPEPGGRPNPTRPTRQR